MKSFVIIMIMVFDITAAQGQTVLPPNSQTNSSASAVGSNAVSAPTPSPSSPSPASQLDTSLRSPPIRGSASGAPGGTSFASGLSQSPVLLPGEMPDTSPQAARTTATAPGPPPPICPPPVPSTDGGSANLSEMAGASLGGC